MLFLGGIYIFLGRQGRFCAPPIVEMLPPPNDVFPKPLQATWLRRYVVCFVWRNVTLRLVDRLIQFGHCFLAPENNIGLLDAMNLWITNKLKACESYDPSKTTCHAFVRVVVWQTASLVKLLAAVFLPLNPVFQVWLSTQKSNSNLEICW